MIVKRILEIPPNSTTVTRVAVLDNWMRAELRERIALLVLKWEELLGVDLP